MTAEFVNLGPQISASTFIGTTFAADARGNILVCSVMRGQPAKLVVFDLASGDVREVLPLAGADGAWSAVTASDGSVYAGTDANGHLYRWIPGDDQVQDLGQVPPKQGWVWALAPGAAAEVFIATYNGCRVVKYRPGEGFTEVSNGPASAGEDYARSVAYDRQTGKIYAGVGSHAHLVEIDPATGNKREMLPPEYASQEFVYGLSVFGEHLFALITKLGKSLVINLRTGQLEAVLPQMNGQQVMTQSPVEPQVYYGVSGRLWVYDRTRPSQPPIDLAACPDPLAMTWLNDSTLAIFTRRASLVMYDLKTVTTTTRQFRPPAEPVVIQSITLGPDGKIWMGGYLSGGNASYDPEQNVSAEYKGLSQAESMAASGESLYFGLYPNGEFAAYDARKPWAEAGDNPKHLGKIEGQSRPFAALAVPQLGKVFFGTVPEYGALGGGIASYDPAEAKLEFVADVVKNQSVIALAYAKGLIVGGTSIWGGLGIKPAEREGKLFLWDPQTRQKQFETVPVNGMAAVTCVINGPDGHIWGVSEGTLFVFDVTRGEIISRHHLFEVSYGGRQIWRDAMLIVHPSGQVYGTLRGRFFRIDPQTMQVTLLREKGAGLLAMDRAGRLYFHQAVNLWQYIP